MYLITRQQKDYNDYGVMEEQPEIEFVGLFKSKENADKCLRKHKSEYSVLSVWEIETDF